MYGISPKSDTERDLKGEGRVRGLASDGKCAVRGTTGAIEGDGNPRGAAGHQEEEVWRGEPPKRALAVTHIEKISRLKGLL